jgi:hypothetical protein
VPQSTASQDWRDEDGAPTSPRTAFFSLCHGVCSKCDRMNLQQSDLQTLASSDCATAGKLIKSFACNNAKMPTFPATPGRRESIDDGLAFRGSPDSLRQLPECPHEGPAHSFPISKPVLPHDDFD